MAGKLYEIESRIRRSDFKAGGQRHDYMEINFITTKSGVRDTLKVPVDEYYANIDKVDAELTRLSEIHDKL